MNSKLKSKEFIFLLLYPVYSLFHIVRNLPVIRKITRKLTGRGNDDDSNIQKMDVTVEVTDGKHSIECALELISEDGLAKVKFTFNKKKFLTSAHLRMVDAIKELTTKLDDYGFTLKICQCCEYFSPNIDGSTNMVKGFCNGNYPAYSANNPVPTLLWNSCPNFKKNASSNIIDKIVG